MTINLKIKFTRQVIVIVGGYGSGKSEVAVNLARYLSVNQSQKVSIADLDIINPYFRSREAAKQLKKMGINSIVPGGDQFHADLPIVLPQIKSSIQAPEGKLILDVGGDEAGARVLSSLANAFEKDKFELLLVLNAKRPFTADIDGCLDMIAEIEASSRLKFTGIIANTHLMDDTSSEIIFEGLDLAQELSKITKMPVKFVSIIDEIIPHIDMAKIDLPILTLNRSLLKPWE